jgi:flagellar L-ring protein FlgH
MKSKIWCYRTTLLMIVAAAGAGCASVGVGERPPEESWDPSTPAMPGGPGTAGAIYREGAMEFFADLRARNVGDVLTIVLDEQTAASKQSSTNTSKSSDLSTSLPLFGGRPVTRNGDALFSNELSGDRSFAGKADASQSNQLDGSITVTVAERLANGNLLVKGEKWITLNQGKEDVRLSGIVRPIDIGPSNTVSSTKVANAHITYSESGALAASNRQGWLSRFFDSAWFPF